MKLICTAASLRSQRDQVSRSNRTKRPRLSQSSRGRFYLESLFLPLAAHEVSRSNRGRRRAPRERSRSAGIRSSVEVVTAGRLAGVAYRRGFAFGGRIDRAELRCPEGQIPSKRSRRVSPFDGVEPSECRNRRERRNSDRSLPSRPRE